LVGGTAAVRGVEADGVAAGGGGAKRPDCEGGGGGGGGANRPVVGEGAGTGALGRAVGGGAAVVAPCGTTLREKRFVIGRATSVVGSLVERTPGSWGPGAVATEAS
jgi:hypothetical protein